MRSSSIRALAQIIAAFGRRSIPARCVARRLNTPQYSPSSRLAGRAPQRPRCDAFIYVRALVLLDCILTGSSVDDLTST